MKFKPDKKYLYVGITIFLTAVAIMLAYFLFFRIDSIKDGLNTLNKILAPIFYGLIIAYLMTPLLNTIEKNCKEMNSNIDDFVKKGIKSEIQMYIHKTMGK